MSTPVIPRVVFDTNTVLSALVFTGSRLAWLRSHWRKGACVPLVSRATAAEIARILAYPKFKLQPDKRFELLGDYLSYCETVEANETCAILCRDTKDQMFLDLAQCGGGDILVSGDQDLLVLAGQTPFAIESPEAYRLRLLGSEPAS